MAAGADVHGTWATEKQDDGAYLEITIAACSSDASLTCGTISKAFVVSGEDPDYVNLGKPMIEGMKDEGGGPYSGGTIRDPEDEKTNESKMTSKGDELDVEGCVSIFCEGQHWARVSN